LWQQDATYEGFEWIDFNDIENSVIIFRRMGRDQGDDLVVLCNFTPVPRGGYRVGLPKGGRYRELLNSDSEIYGGGNVGNLGTIEAEEVASHHHPFSVRTMLPPLGILILKREVGPEER
jgi:1,4-alpha-glucan branching enzyme